MKTKNTIIGIALLALTTASFGQLSSIKERLFNRQKNQAVYVTAKYTHQETSRIESWMHDARDWASNITSREANKKPVVSQTIILARAEIIYEKAISLESWMATPFESSVDEEISLESWMATPFDSSLDEEIILESWMTAPFESNLDEEISMESWMTAPFETTRETEIEAWMEADCI